MHCIDEEDHEIMHYIDGEGHEIMHYIDGEDHEIMHYIGGEVIKSCIVLMYPQFTILMLV